MLAEKKVMYQMEFKFLCKITSDATVPSPASSVRRVSEYHVVTFHLGDATSSLLLLKSLREETPHRDKIDPKKRR